MVALFNTETIKGKMHNRLERGRSQKKADCVRYSRNRKVEKLTGKNEQK